MCIVFVEVCNLVGERRCVAADGYPEPLRPAAASVIIQAVGDHRRRLCGAFSAQCEEGSSFVEFGKVAPRSLYVLKAFWSVHCEFLLHADS